MQVGIIDYGMSNLGSVKRAFEECGATAQILSSPDESLNGCTHLVLPGVGAYPKGMANLHQRGWVSAIKKTVTENHIPLLGICLGMQLLAESGTEGEETQGLGLIEGKVLPLSPPTKDTRIPHIGWNEVFFENDSPLLSNIPQNADFYFVHSYHFAVKFPQNAVAQTPYCGNFTSIVSNQNIYGVQFHPEKSQKLGLQMLTNFLRNTPC